jgi:hypothetical protein
MNIEKVVDKKEQSVINKNNTLEKPWELSKENNSFFDRKFKALEFFGNKLKGNKEESSNFSKEAVSKLEGRVTDLNLDSFNPEEINTIKQQINDLEKQKQEVINHGEVGIKKLDVESSGWSLSPEDQSFFDRKFKAQGEFSDKLVLNKEQTLEKSNIEYTSFEEVEKMGDMDKNDSLKLTHRPDITNKIKTEDVQEKIEKKEVESIEKPTEKIEEEQLGPGDEVYSNGNFYKIFDIYNPTVEEEQQMWEGGKLDRNKEFQEKSGRLPYKEGSDRFFQEGEKFEEQKKKELKERGPIITAIIKGGEEKIQIDSRNIIKITSPEQRERIVKMQKEADEAEGRAANYMGMGNTKKMVDKITGQPGKF